MKERRQYLRLAVDDLDVQTSAVVSSEAEIHDISTTGVSILCARRLRVGGEYTLRFEFEGVPPVAVRGVVKWETQVGRKKIGGKDLLFLAGIELRDVMTSQMTRIIDFMKEIIDGRDKRLKGIRFKIPTHEKAVVEGLETCSVRLISLSGMLIETKRALSEGEFFPMELFLPDDDRPINFRGRIASSQEAAREGIRLFRTGVEFTAMTLDDRARLNAFLRFVYESQGRI